MKILGLCLPLPTGLSCEAKSVFLVPLHGPGRFCLDFTSHGCPFFPLVGGKPVSAEYRETKRERFKDGTKAGELTGKTELIMLKTWKPEDNHFNISDKKLMAEFDQILKRTESTTKPSAAPLSCAPSGYSEGAR